MICSTAEVEALVLRAARGAGLPLGAAQEFAGIVGYFSEDDSSHWTELVAALTPPIRRAETYDEGLALVFSTARVALDGPAAIDAALCGCEVYLKSVDAPAIMALMVEAAESDFEVCLATEMPVDAVQMVLKLRPFDEAASVKLHRPSQLDIPEPCYALLTALAAKTFVPASEASRQSGAGSGLTDND